MRVGVERDRRGTAARGRKPIGSDKALMRCVAVGVIAAPLLAACGGGPATPGNSNLQNAFRGTTQAPQQPDLGPELVAGCPDVSINPGTESLRRDGGNDSEETLRFQASINNTARECKRAEGGSTVRVGVSGRVVEGPAGAPSTIELPVRVAVRESGEVTYSRLHSVQVSLDSVSKSWAFVDEAVFVSDPSSAIIVVGFDS